MLVVNNTNRLLKPGAVFGNYTIEKLLGHGGMGAVYLVRHNVLDTLFALKVLYPAAVKKNRDFVDRFIREAKLASKIRHPNLITVHDAGRNPKHNLYYLVMDYVPGGSVRDLLKKELRLDPEPALKIIIQVARALCAAYDNHMVHRDIKPDNIMFASDGTAKLADLGLAKSTDDQDSSLTVTSAVFGTPAYMSPEQAVDSGKVDIRADIYSLGIVFYEMLAGQRPYRGDSIMEILAQVVAEAEVPDIRTIRPRIPVELAELIAAMTAKTLAKRIQTPAELLQRLENLRIPADWDKTGDSQEQLSAADPMKTVQISQPAPFRKPPVDGRAPSAVKIPSSPDVSVAGDHPGSGSKSLSPLPPEMVRPSGRQKRIYLLIGANLLVILLLLALLWGISVRKGGKSASSSPTTKGKGANDLVMPADDVKKVEHQAPAITSPPMKSRSDVKSSGAAPVIFEPAAGISNKTDPQAAGEASAASPEISSDPLSRNQIVLLAGTSDFARGLKAGLVRSFGREKVSFQKAESMGRSKDLLKSIIRSSPAVVVIAFSDKYQEDHISAASFENLIQQHADLLRDNGIKLVFALAPEAENDWQIKAFNRAIRDLCKLRSIPLVLNDSRQNADLTKTIRDLNHQ